MVDCPCGYAKNIPEAQKNCPNCGIDVTPLHRLKAIPRSCYEEGIQLLKIGDLDRALERLMAAITLDGGSASAYLAVGDIYARSGLPAQALHNYEKASELAPANEKIREAKDKASGARKNVPSGIGWLRLYGIAAASLAVGLILSLSFEHFARQADRRPVETRKLAANVADSLKGRAVLAGVSLSVVPSPGGLTISGEVPSSVHRELVNEIARNVTGDRVAVISNIDVKPLTKPNETPAGFEYTLKPGDTLTGLAAKFYGDGQQWERIFKANKGKIENPRTLVVGQVILIPST